MNDYTEIVGNLDDWRKAGKIASEALEYGRKLVKPGAKFIEVADLIETKIVELGGQCAFPCGLSLDHVAAHQCPDPDDKIVFAEQVVKLDVGVHVNGAIGDNAVTIDLSGKYSDLAKSSKAAVDAVAKEIHVGMELRKIGKIVSDTITSYGYKPIRNLSGHGLMPYDVHEWPTVPNYDNQDTTKLVHGMIIACEPFATDGEGLVNEAEDANIFSMVQKRPIRSPITRAISPDVESYKTLPFTTRWLSRTHHPVKLNFALREMVQSGMLHAYPPLLEAKRGMVSQHERTFFVGEDKVECLTPWKI